MDVAIYFDLKRRIIEAGFEADVTWAENVGECPDAISFSREHAFVVCNSGMKATIACEIFRRVFRALEEGKPLNTVFGHKLKCRAIQYVYDNRERLFAEYMALESNSEKLDFLESLPHIGGIIKYHLFKNFGGDCAKPDRHLVRIAGAYETTAADLCERLSRETGDRIGTVDVVIWRAASLGFV